MYFVGENFDSKEIKVSSTYKNKLACLELTFDGNLIILHINTKNVYETPAKVRIYIGSNSLAGISLFFAIIRSAMGASSDAR